MASPQRWNHAREGKRVEQKFRDLMQISSSSANKIHRRRCKASQNLRLAVPRPTLSLSTYGVRLFFSSFLFLRAIVLLIQTEYSSYCSSLLSHASRYISQAGKLNLAQGERERERKSYDSRGIRRFFFLFLFFLFFSSSRGLGFNFETKF